MPKFFYRGADFAKEVIEYGFAVQTILDIGARHGESIDYFRRYFPRSRICSFEPHPEHFLELKRRFGDLLIEGLGITDIYNLAIGSAIGSHELVLQGAGTHLARHNETFHEKSCCTVDVCTIDSFLVKEAIHNVDILKIDIEGGELAALEGAVESLGAGRIGFVYLEAGAYRENTHHTFYRDMIDFLEPMGFLIFGFYEQINEFLLAKPQLRRCNIGFIHRSLCSD